MRAILRVPALVSLAGFVLALIEATSLYRADPCPPGLGGLVYLAPVYDIFVLGIATALIGSIPALVFAARRRQWVWLAVLPVAALPGLAIVGGFLNLLPSDIASPLLWLARIFGDVVICGKGGTEFAFDLAFAVLLAPAPIVLLIYSFWGASWKDSPTDTARHESDTRPLLWGAAIIALASGALLDGLLLIPSRNQQPPLVVGVVGVLGWNVALLLGGVLTVFAVQRRDWAWFAGLLVTEATILWLDLPAYVRGFAAYRPLSVITEPLYRLFPIYYRDAPFGILYNLRYVLSIAPPLVLLAYIWWSDRRSRRSRSAGVAPPPPVPVAAP